MQLRRSTHQKHFPDYHTQGRWVSADGRFAFRRGEDGWKISVLKIYPGTPGQLLAQKHLAVAIRKHGINIAFKTRSAAVEALEMVLGEKE